MDRDTLLVLDDGTIFSGYRIGVKGITAGELIFNTAHVGYQEALTDPSYTAQIIIFTSPHIGNTGCNSQDEESNGIKASGLILRELPTQPSHWQKNCSLQEYLENHNITGIAGIDTRYLTQLLRDRGHFSACISAEDCDVKEAQQLAINFSEMRSAALLDKVSTALPYRRGLSRSTSIKNPHVVVYDFGVKWNILRLLEQAGCSVTVVPASFNVEKLIGINPDGILLSNGPGDPLAYMEVIQNIKKLIQFDIPMLGICLGHQLLGIAMGARIEKLKFGHHGINHPIQDLMSKRVMISSQNHNFSIVQNELPKMIKVTHRSLFDFSIQGIKHSHKLIFGIQGHPEGCPGPTEHSILMDPFLNAVNHHYLEKQKQQQLKQATSNLEIQTG